MISLSQYISRLEATQFRLLDQQFAQFLQQLEPENTALELAGFILSAHLGKGHVCLDFSQSHENLNEAELKQLKKTLVSSQLVCVLQEKNNVSLDTVQKPLVLEANRLYLQRYWLYEKQLESSIKQRLIPKEWDLASQQDFIAELFGLSKHDDEPDWQAIAACISAQRTFSVISGGPGTGKTTTVVRLLALLVQLYQTQLHTKPIIKLVAPTGKAAMRLTESISSAKQQLKVDAQIKQLIPEQASTVHRLLKSNGQGAFKFNAFSPLHLDVLIVDEASMVDLPLMAKLLQALPPHGQLILLGDKDQLASVEAGSVLADICDSDVEHGYGQSHVEELSQLLNVNLTDFIEPVGADLRNHICHLRKSYRFDAQSGIGHLSAAANKGDVKGWQTVVEHGYQDLQLWDLSEAHFEAFVALSADFYAEYIQRISQLAAGSGITDEQAHELHALFNRFQVLCALREGRLGVTGLNDMIEQRLKRKGIINPEQIWYLGRPVMIMQNDYGLNLYNGDIGLLLPKSGDDGKVRLKAAFIGTDQNVRWLQASRLPSHETVYAMTVHKSQGSEFEHCALVLPDHNTQVLTKELIYTGITRAKKQLTCIGKTSVIHQALQRQVQRASGLRERLWQAPVERLTGNPVADNSQFSLF